MYDVLEGIRVVEVAEWTFVPIAGSVLADWGADVIKVEHREGGDPQRGLLSMLAMDGAINPFMEVANRGKRSVGIDLNTEGGRETLYKLVASADVFLTSLRTRARKKLGIEPEDLLKIKPDLIYGRGTGFGLQGPDANKGGYDEPVTWCRAGISARMTPPDGHPPAMPGSIGDINGGTQIAGAVAAALVKRLRTGKGSIVDNSLYSVGAWIMCQSIVGTYNGPAPGYRDRSQVGNPLVNQYRTKDNRWLSLCLIQADAWWQDFCEHIGREDLIDDPRFNNMKVRNENGKACMEELDKTFAEKTLDEWRAAMDTMVGVWSPLQTIDEVVKDEQALVNGIVTPVKMGDTSSYMAAASPAQFDEQLIGDLQGCPEPGQHTEEVLLELGMEWDEIAALKEAEAIQ